VDYYGTTITLKNKRQNDWSDKSLGQALQLLLETFALNYKIVFWDDNDILSPLLLSNKIHILDLKRPFAGEKFDTMVSSTINEEEGERKANFTTVKSDIIFIILNFLVEKSKVLQK